MNNVINLLFIITGLATVSWSDSFSATILG